MRSETMTSKERIACALALEKPDRPPIAMNWGSAATSALGGYKNYELAVADLDKLLSAELKVFDEYGGWDGIQGPSPVSLDMFLMLGMKVAPPTPERPEMQVIEQENMTYDDYDVVVDIGIDEYKRQVLMPRLHGWDTAKWDAASADAGRILAKALPEYERREAEIIFAAWDHHPFFSFSLMRSMLTFTEDLYYRPEKLRQALRRGTEDFIKRNLDLKKTYGAPCASVVEERAGSFFYPLRVFEEFWWPYTVEIVEALWSEGIVSVFHLDSPWDKNLPYWKKLPRGSCVIDLDGTSDIFAAKELLRGHCCFYGDVSATLLALGSADEVEAYVRKLIDGVGGDGGFILSSGCSLPGAIRPENFKAYLKADKAFGLN